MKQIRRGVFETNSSSSHSLVIKKGDCYVDQNVDVNEEDIWIWDGKLHFSENELIFERRPFQILSSISGKLRYLCASYGNDEDAISEIIEVAKDVTGCDSIDFPESDWSSYDNRVFYGYVDHQSSGSLKKYLEQNRVSFREFLTNKKYIVIIDGDEYDEWGKLKRSGLVNLDEIETEVGW